MQDSVSLQRNLVFIEILKQPISITTTGLAQFTNQALKIYLYSYQRVIHVPTELKYGFYEAMAATILYDIFFEGLADAPPGGLPDCEFTLMKDRFWTT